MQEHIETALAAAGALVAVASVVSPALRKVGNTLFEAALRTEVSWDDNAARRTREALFTVADGLDVVADVVGVFSIKGKQGDK